MGCVQKSTSSDPPPKNQEKDDIKTKNDNDREPLSRSLPMQTDIIGHSTSSDSIKYKNEGLDLDETDEEGKESNPLKTKSIKKEAPNHRNKNKKRKNKPTKSNTNKNYKNTKENIKETNKKKKKFKPNKRRISNQKINQIKKKQAMEQSITINTQIVDEKEKEKDQQIIAKPKPKRKPKRKPKPSNKKRSSLSKQKKKKEIVDVEKKVDKPTPETHQSHIGEKDEEEEVISTSQPTPGENWSIGNDEKKKKTAKVTPNKRYKENNIVVLQEEEEEDKQLISKRKVRGNWKVDQDDNEDIKQEETATTKTSKKRNGTKSSGTDCVYVEQKDEECDKLTINTNDNDDAKKKKSSISRSKKKHAMKGGKTVDIDTDISITEEKKEKKQKALPWSKWDIDHQIDGSERRFSIGSPREFEKKQTKKNKLEIKRKNRKKKKKQMKKNDNDIRAVDMDTNITGKDPEIETQENKSDIDADHETDGSPRDFISEVKQRRNRKKNKKNIEKNENDGAKQQKTATAPTRHAMKRAKTVDIDTNITDIDYETEGKEENTGNAFPWSKWDIDRQHQQEHQQEKDRSQRRFSIGSPREFEIKQTKKNETTNGIYSSDNELEIKRKHRKKKKKKHKKNDKQQKIPTRHAMKRAQTVDIDTNITAAEFAADHEENKENNKTFPWTQTDIADEAEMDKSQRRFSIGSPREFEVNQMQKSKTNDAYSSDNELEKRRKKRRKKKKKMKKRAKKRGQTLDMNNPIFPWSDWETETDIDVNRPIDTAPKRSQTERRARTRSPRQIKQNKVANDRDVHAYASDNELEIKRNGKGNEFKVDMPSPEPLREGRRGRKKRKLRAKHRTSSLPPYDFNKYNAELIKSVRTESKRDLSTLFNEPEKRKQSKKLKNLSRNGFEIHINHRYKLVDGRIGVCKYRGRTVFGKSSEDWIGLVVDVGDGEHNGTVKGKCYFRCRDGKGLFVRPYDIIKDMGSHNKLLNKNDVKLAKHDIKRFKKKEKKHITTSSVVLTNDDWGNAMSPDHGDDIWNEKYYNPVTLLDKNKGMKVDKKDRHFQV